MKSLIISACLFASIVLCNTPLYQKQIEYVPVDIERHDSALDINFNNRKDLLNVDQKYVALRRLEKDRKNVLRGDLTRFFGPKTIIAWADFLQGQNFNMLPKYEFKEDLFDLKTMSKQLQTYIIQRSNSIKDKLALLDLKVKEQQLLDKEIFGLRMIQSGKIMDTPEARQRYEDIASNIATYHTEFDTAIHGMCDTLKKINRFVKQMKATDVIMPQAVPQISKPAPKKVKPMIDIVKEAILSEITLVLVEEVTTLWEEPAIKEIIKDEVKITGQDPKKVKGMLQGEVGKTVKKTADTIANTASKKIQNAPGSAKEIRKDIKGSIIQMEDKLEKQIKQLEKKEPAKAAMKAAVADALDKLKKPNEVQKMTNAVLKALRRK